MRLFIALAALLAQLVLAWTARDTFYLQTLPLQRLPLVIVASGLLAIVAGFFVARAMVVHGPRRILIGVLFASAALHMLLWWTRGLEPRAIAILLWVQTDLATAIVFASHGAFVSKKYGARNIRALSNSAVIAIAVGAIAAIAIVEALARNATIGAALWALACLEVVAAIAIVSHREKAPAVETAPSTSLLAAPRSVFGTPYLRLLALTVVVAATCAVPLDYALKERVLGQSLTGGSMFQFFGRFYGIAACAAFMLQPILGRLVLERGGLGTALAILPLAVFAGAATLLAFPRLAFAMLARAVEFTVRRGTFRPAYEVLYTPVETRARVGANAFVDCTAERSGEALGALAVAGLLVVGAGDARAMAALGLVFALATFAVVRRLSTAYVQALEASLAARAVEIAADEVTDRTTRALMNRRQSDLRQSWQESSVAIPVAEIRRALRESEARTEAARATAAAPPAATPSPSPETAARVSDLRSGDPDRIRRVLRTPGPIDRSLVPYVVPLLANDAVAADAIEALTRTAPLVTGLLVDVLVDPDEPLAVRRRLPRVLAHTDSPRAVEGLFRSLEDPRSEMRLHSARALARLHVAHPSIAFDRERIMGLILSEARRGRRAWEGQYLADKLDDTAESPLVDEVLRDRANRSLEHVFALLSLVLPLAPLRAAFAGVHSDDAALRRTALEYLESVLPPDVRGSLWPLLAERGSTPRTGEASKAIADIVDSNQSVQIDLEELRRRLREGS